MKIQCVNWEFCQIVPILLLTLIFSTQSRATEKVEIFSDWRSSPASYSEAPYSSKRKCESLQSWSVEPAQVLLAKLHNKTDALPEYCDVLGHIQSNIKFRLFLPAHWNGRFFMVGNGGLAGDDLLEPGYPQHLNKMKAAIRLGFATVMTDSGHSDKEQPGGSFAHNNFSAEIDFAFRAIHLVSDTAKILIRDNYKQKPEYSYFDGCSGGGRQGLMSVQRYPGDFNGVVAGAPAFNHTALSVARMLFNPVLKNAQLSLAQIKALGKLITAECDLIDGASDGLIENPLACTVDFDALLPLCRNTIESNSCFMPEQVQAIKTLHADTYVDGARLQAGYPLASDLSLANGWGSWLPNSDNKEFDFGQYYSEELLRYIAFDKDDPARSLADFDAERDVKNFGLAMRLIDATDTNIQVFQKSGGKLLMYMGWQDMAFSSRATVEYYEALTERMGETTDEHARLFMAPGMYHCFGGPGPNKFDYMTPLINWVEKDIAPDRIIAHQYSGDKQTRTHPLCPWPQVARYTGRGPIEEADSFRCINPE
ncbi:MAG: tannase/feruloyl esterase family alpha/beta hydrolase [Gammaproteobacteria bacterium]|nr:tannase/feruloyl esterase family alpha/beta hydrolase [Gammaproteobacteria bacterium]